MSSSLFISLVTGVTLFHIMSQFPEKFSPKALITAGITSLTIMIFSVIIIFMKMFHLIYLIIWR